MFNTVDFSFSIFSFEILHIQTPSEHTNPNALGCFASEEDVRLMFSIFWMLQFSKDAERERDHKFCFNAWKGNVSHPKQDRLSILTHIHTHIFRYT